MLIFWILLAGSIFCEICGVYDAAMTEKGIRAGVATEGDTWLTSNKPSAVALYLRDNLMLAFCVAPAIIFAKEFHNLPVAYGACIAPVIYGIRHIQGGLAWAKLLKGK